MSKQATVLWHVDVSTPEITVRTVSNRLVATIALNDRASSDLIAAAPEMLQDLKLALMHMDACPTHTAPYIAEMLRKTIAKAEGK